MKTSVSNLFDLCEVAAVFIFILFFVVAAVFRQNMRTVGSRLKNEEILEKH